MTALLIVLGALLLLGLVPLAVDIAYDGEDGFSPSVRVWLVSVRPGGKKAGGEKPEKAAAPAEKKKRLPSPGVMKLLLTHGYGALCRLLKRARVDILILRFTAASPDPAAAAMEYAAAGTALDGLRLMGEGRVRRMELRAGVDFDGAHPLLTLHVRAGLRLGVLIGIGLRFGAGFLWDFIHLKKEER